ncbi:M20 family metallopeptidase [Paraclostridium bifermentans]|uniref:M20 family metallopeptidase n=1 Tax=Paraclostridium bifermentans TaxID=1490 RepID=UPI0018AC6A1F|nr:M20 family metallopeptidase [Paraclostridium bifermentans]
MKNLDLDKLKNDVLDTIEKNKEVYINISHKIHSNPEIGNEEYFACEILSNLLKENGFEVETNIAGHPTGFLAKKKSEIKEGPIIAFLAEYDALPGIGHACGHNIIGATSCATAITLSSQLNHIGGEIRVYGCPSEEGGENGSAKGSIVKANLFEGVDACLMIHPSNETSITGNSLAVDPVDFEFIGKSAHAAGCPEKGINALDGVIQLFNGVNALRQHLTDDVRIHGIITHGGDAPNIVPEYAKARFYIRAKTRNRLNEVTKKVENIAKGAALSTGSIVNIRFFQNKVDNFYVNKKFNDLFIEAMEELGEYVNKDLKEGLGSTDAGNVSQVIPTLHPYIKIGPKSLVGHTIEFRDAACSKEGDKSLIIGIKAISLVALKLFTDNKKLKDVKEEFKYNKN